MKDVLAEICEKVIQLEKSGQRIIKLHTVDPDLPVDKKIITSAIQSLKNGETHYSSSAGLLELRKSLARKYNTSSDNVVIGNGSRSLLYGLVQSILDNGDEVIIPEPEWAHFLVPFIKQKSVTVFRVPRDETKSWDIDINYLKNKITSRTKLILVSDPNNPTGTFLSSQRLQKLQKISRKRHIYLIYDSAYSTLELAKQKKILDLKNPFFILLGTFSKGFAMPGFRVGYLISENKHLIDQIINFNYVTIQCLPEFTQKAAITALKNEENILQKARNIYSKRLDSALKILAKNHIRFVRPKAAPFIYLYVGKNKAEELAYILIKNNISVCPSTAFSNCDDYIRVSLTVGTKAITKALTLICKNLK